MHVALPPSGLTMSRLIGHMCMVERIWFHVRFAGEEMSEPWRSLDFTDDVDAEMTFAQTLSREALEAEFRSVVEDSRRHAAAAESLDAESARANADGERWNLRWILIHMIEEYARHCGHADLIRESIDGNSAS